jgi:hypothetical protein
MWKITSFVSVFGVYYLLGQTTISRVATKRQRPRFSAKMLYAPSPVVVIGSENETLNRTRGIRMATPKTSHFGTPKGPISDHVDSITCGAARGGVFGTRSGLTT